MSSADIRANICFLTLSCRRDEFIHMFLIGILAISHVDTVILNSLFLHLHVVS